MKSDRIEIIKASGDRVKFSLNKLKISLKMTDDSND